MKKELQRLYNINENTLKQVTDGFQNMVYSYESEGTERILRITSKCKRSYEMIEEELRWIQYLSEKGITVANATPSIEGNLIESVQDFYVISFEKAEGGHVQVGDLSEWNTDLFEKWGQLVGKMHQASKSYPYSKNRPVWSIQNPDLYRLEPQGTLKTKYEKLLKELESFHVSDDTFGLIHFDLHQGNFFVQNQTITFFDFDDCSYYWFAYDIAVSYYHAYWQSMSWHREWKTFGKDFLYFFLKGYQRHNILSAEMVKQLPVFLKIRDIFLYQLFQEKWNHNQLLDWQREKLAELLNNIENEVTYPVSTSLLSLEK
ncbi:phosphotransferase [Bacillus sp. BGMRC 2118]|nr:phosphotransferase [Bacillus sp. BGMRC 2118]